VEAVRGSESSLFELSWDLRRGNLEDHEKSTAETENRNRDL
jgi:hypothetical protein